MLVALAGALGHRREDHDGDRARGGVGTQPTQRLHAVDAGQMDVHEDQRRSLLLREAHAVLAGLRLDHAVPFVDQHVARQLAALVVVLDEDDQLAGHGAPGSVNANVEPWPG